MKKNSGKKFTTGTIYNMEYWKEFLEKQILNQMITAHEKNARKSSIGHFKTLKGPEKVSQLMRVLQQVAVRKGISEEDLNCLKDKFQGVKEIESFVDSQLKHYQHMRGPLFSQDDASGESSARPRSKDSHFDETVYLAVVDEEAAAVLAEQMSDPEKVNSKQIIIIDRDASSGGCSIDKENPMGSRIFQKTPDYYHAHVSQSLKNTPPQDVAQLELTRNTVTSKRDISGILFGQKRKI